MAKQIVVTESSFRKLKDELDYLKTEIEETIVILR